MSQVLTVMAVGRKLPHQVEFVVQAPAEDFDALLEDMRSGAAPMYAEPEAAQSEHPPLSDEPGYDESIRPYLY